MNCSKISARLFSLILAAQLFTGTIPFTPIQSVAWAQSCSSGLAYNAILGRCLSTEQAALVAQAAQVCESKATAAEKKKCYLDVVDGKVKDAEASGAISEAGKVKSDALPMILALGGMGASVAFLAKKGQCPGAMSAYLIAGGGVAVLAGEILSKKEYKKKMKEAEAKLKEINEGSEGTTSTTGTTSDTVNATNVQVEAFNALILQEEAVIAASKTKKKLYLLATAAYGAATVMAAMELVKGPAAVCKTQSGANKAVAGDEKVAAAQKEVTAAGDKATDSAKKALTDAQGSAAAAQGIIVSKGYTALFSNPATRTALAGILTANNVMMMSKISKEQKKAEERKAFLEKLRDEVSAAGVAFTCTSADRSNPGNIKCYCYSEGGALNPARTKSSICAGLFTSQNLAATSYSTDSGEAIPSSCTTSTGNLDETCSCKSTNTCLSVSGLSGNLGSAGINLGSIPTTLDSINNGTLNGASLDANALTAQAARANQILKAIEAKNPSIAASNEKAKKAAAALNNNLSRGAASAAASMGPGGGMDSFGDSMMSAKSPEQALEAMKQEIGRVEARTNAASGTRSNDEELNFGGLGGAPAGGVTIDDSQLAAVMENALATGNSDISSSNGNIFEILSNRYQRSGMRRLFGESTLPTEKANESDISK